jgi:hypothetical protein
MVLGLGNRAPTAAIGHDASRHLERVSILQRSAATNYRRSATSRFPRIAVSHIEECPICDSGLVHICTIARFGDRVRLMLHGLGRSNLPILFFNAAEKDREGVIYYGNSCLTVLATFARITARRCGKCEFRRNPATD